MLLHAWVLLPYLAMGSALLLAATIAVICLHSEPVEFRGFVTWPERRPLAPRRISQLHRTVMRDAA